MLPRALVPASAFGVAQPLLPPLLLMSSVPAIVSIPFPTDTLLQLQSTEVRRGRSWEAILVTSDGGSGTVGPSSIADVAPIDPFRSIESEILVEEEPLKYSLSPSSAPSKYSTDLPSSMPSSIPSQVPTEMPNEHPSGAPTLTTLSPSESPTSSPSESPTGFPSHLPSGAPSKSPTVSPTPRPTPRPTTNQPTFQPTIDWTIDATNPVPPSNQRPRGYFNYDPNDSKYGPKGWGSLSVQTSERKYWEEFKEYLRTDLDTNKCDKNSKTNMQSPIDVRMDGTGKKDATCLQYHEFRHKQGIYPMADSALKKQILPSKLRLLYPRRPPGVEDGRTVPGPPSADVPKGWGYQLDVVHIDFKTPSEHMMEGKRYLGEYQIYIIQKKGRGVPAVSVLMDYHPQDEDNEALQVALDAFQDVFDANARPCGLGRRRRRAGENNNVTTDAADSPTKESLSSTAGRDLTKRGTLRPDLPWDPWHPLLVPTVWFFGYKGSMTEPPCSEFIQWHVFTKPMLISRRQLRQMKELLVNQVDSDCRRTSTSYHGSVARPIEPLAGREMYNCNCRNFLSDDDRKWYGRNRCWEGEEYVFHPDEFPNPVAQGRAATL